MSNLPDNVTELDVGGPEQIEREYVFRVTLFGTIAVNDVDEESAREKAADALIERADWKTGEVDIEDTEVHDLIVTH